MGCWVSTNHNREFAWHCQYSSHSKILDRVRSECRVDGLYQISNVSSWRRCPFQNILWKVLVSLAKQNLPKWRIPIPFFDLWCRYSSLSQNLQIQLVSQQMRIHELGFAQRMDNRFRARKQCVESIFHIIKINNTKSITLPIFNNVWSALL